jgi:hypothetical protein
VGRTHIFCKSPVFCLSYLVVQSMGRAKICHDCDYGPGQKKLNRNKLFHIQMHRKNFKCKAYVTASMHKHAQGEKRKIGIVFVKV